MDSFELEKIIVKVIPSDIARVYTVKYHYMKTFPNSVVCFWVIYDKRLMWVITFWYSTQTEAKIKKLIPHIEKNEYLEMQRMNIKDELWKNTESYVLWKIMKILKSKWIKAVITHSWWCKNDCWIVYQSSSRLYFWKEVCNDFYLTEKWEYKNIIAPARFGRVPKWIKWWQAIWEYLFWKWKLIKSYRYFYIYPINKWIRAYLEKKALPYPKDSAMFRKDGVRYKGEAQ